MSVLSLAFEPAAAETVGPFAGQVAHDAPVLFIVPAFNEVENVPRLVADLEQRPELFTPSSRILVVDDGSTDGTAELVEAYDGPLVIDVLRLGTNQGPGAAFRAGFEVALAGCPGECLVVTLEADTTCDLDALPTMLAHARTDADLVLASVHGGGRMINVGFVRRVLSRGAGAVVRMALGVDARTVSSFFRVYRGSLLRAANVRYGADLIREPGFACKAELLAKLSTMGARVDEIPVDLDASRRIGESKMNVAETLAGYRRLITSTYFSRNSVS